MITRLLGYAMLLGWLPASWLLAACRFGSLQLGVLQSALALGLSFPGLWLLAAAWRRGRHAAALRRAALGQHPDEGAFGALCGDAEAVDAPFKAPLSGRAALAAECRVTALLHREHGGHHRPASRRAAHRNVLLGLELVPTRIRAGAASATLAGFPDLRNLDPIPGAGPIDPLRWEGARRGGYWPLRQWTLSVLRCRPCERVAHYWRFGTLDEQERRELCEWLLAPGDRVCVLGRRRGLRIEPDPFEPDGLPIYSGSPADALRVALEQGQGSLWLGLGLLVAAAGLLVWLAL